MVKTLKLFEWNFWRFDGFHAYCVLIWKPANEVVFRKDTVLSWVKTSHLLIASFQERKKKIHAVDIDPYKLGNVNAPALLSRSAGQSS